MEPGSESGPRSVPKGRHLKAADICFSATGQGLGKPVRGSPQRVAWRGLNLELLFLLLSAVKTKGLIGPSVADVVAFPSGVPAGKSTILVFLPPRTPQF